MRVTESWVLVEAVCTYISVGLYFGKCFTCCKKKLQNTAFFL